MKTALKNNKVIKAGFSLVEMLVVIAVIGIMAAIAVPTIGNMTATAKTNKAKRNAQSAASVWASAAAAGADLSTGTTVTLALGLLNTGVTGDTAAGFGSTNFKVAMSTTEQDLADDYLTIANGLLVYNPG